MASRKNAAQIFVALSAANEAILRTTSEGEIFQRVCDAALSGGQFVLAAAMLVGPDKVFQVVAGAGVGTLGIVDDDVVTLSNLHRQIIHGTGEVGRLKTGSAVQAIRRINPHVAVETIAQRLDAANARGAPLGHAIRSRENDVSLAS